MSAVQSRLRQLIAASLILLTGLMTGCAHQNARDPLEPLNRGIYAVNDAIDRAVMKPVATGYRAVLPGFVQTGVSNFFSNLDDITVIVNGILQLKIPQAASDTGRFLINSTIGLLGFFDVATQLGLEKHNEDFGQTLGYWGIGSGPYLVLPLLGPSSFRDGIGRLVDWKTDVLSWEDHIRTRNQLIALRAVSDRANLLDSEKVLDTAALDRYTFLRDAYLQRRRSLVYDGNPPPEPEEDEPDNTKPRSEAEPAPVSVLMDQFGGVVAGAPARPDAPKAAAGAVRPPEPAAAQPADAAAAPAPVPPPAALRSEPAQPSESAAEPARSTRVVRVWLPGETPN
jgi:phospholipid-binding lipoprotein MlaA